MRHVTAAVCLALLLPALAQANPTPRETVEAFTTAMLSGEPAKARALAIGTDQNFQIIDSIAGLSLAMKELHAAGFKKWGDQARELGAENPAELVVDALKDATEEIDGDNAKVGRKGEGTLVQLKRVGGVWRVDLTVSPLRTQIEASTQVIKVMTSSALEVARNIAANKYVTVDEARRAYVQMVLDGLVPPAPATQPAP